MGSSSWSHDLVLFAADWYSTSFKDVKDDWLIGSSLFLSTVTFFNILYFTNISFLESLVSLNHINFLTTESKTV